MKINEALSMLGITTSTPTRADVKKAYRDQIKIWHPDVHDNKLIPAEALQKSQYINEAYQLATEQIHYYGNKFDSNLNTKDLKPEYRYNNNIYTNGFPDENVFEIFLKSSNILSAGYNYEKKLLYIKYDNNNVYMYYGVHNDIFLKFINAESHGKFAHKFIYHSFKYEMCVQPNKPYSGPTASARIDDVKDH